MVSTSSGVRVQPTRRSGQRDDLPGAVRCCRARPCRRQLARELIPVEHARRLRQPGQCARIRGCASAPRVRRCARQPLRTGASSAAAVADEPRFRPREVSAGRLAAWRSVRRRTLRHNRRPASRAARSHPVTAAACPATQVAPPDRCLPSERPRERGRPRRSTRGQLIGRGSRSIGTIGGQSATRISPRASNPSRS